MQSTTAESNPVKIGTASVLAYDIDVQQRIQRLDKLGSWLDTAIPIPGTTFTVGWDTIIGLIPAAGDMVTTAMSAWIINEARHLGVSKFTLARMIANTSVDALIGSIPVAGDLFDAAFKANVKNLRLLRNSLKRRNLLANSDALPS